MIFSYSSETQESIGQAIALVLAVALLIVIILVGIKLHSKAHHNRRSKFLHRIALPINEWIKQNLGLSFLPYEQLVLEILSIMSREIDVYPTQLTSTDGLVDAMMLDGCVLCEDDTIDSIRDELTDRFGVQWSNAWVTVGDVVEGVVRSLHAQDPIFRGSRL